MFFSVPFPPFIGCEVLKTVLRSVSETSDASFEELVVIQEKQDAASESIPHLAAREEADRLSALDALAARSGITATKQVNTKFCFEIYYI